MKATAERILEAGIACFAETGYSGTTTRTLAKAAGVNVATLAYHFGGKEGCYRAAIDRLYERLFALAPDLDAVELGGSPAERLETVMRFLYRFASAHRPEMRLLLRHVLEHGTLPGPVRETWTGELLKRAELFWHEKIGLAPDPAWKLKLLSLNHVMTRYVVSEPVDLAPFVSEEDVASSVEDHLVWLAQRLLVGSGGK